MLVTRSKKLFITTPTFPPLNSGLGNAVAMQAKCLSRAGYQVTVLTGGEARLSEHSNDGYGIERFAVHGALWIKSPIRGDKAGYLTFIRENKPDIILLNAWQTWSTDLVLTSLMDTFSIKILYSHGLATDIIFQFSKFRSAMRWLLWRPYKANLKKWLTKLDGFISLAPSGCDNRFADVYLAKKYCRNLFVVPNAVPEYAENLYLKAVGFQERRQLIAVGAFDKAKGHDFALRVYAKSEAKNLYPIKFFGQSYTTEVDNLKEIGISLGVRPQFISFEYGVSGTKLVNEYAKSLVLLIGSHTECQPLVIIDALAAGTPFVARRTGCIPSMEGGCSVVSEEMAAEAVNALIANEQLWSRLSAEGFDSAKTRFNREIVCHDLCQAIEGVMSSSAFSTELQGGSDD